MTAKFWHRGRFKGEREDIKTTKCGKACQNSEYYDKILAEWQN